MIKSYKIFIGIVVLFIIGGVIYGVYLIDRGMDMTKNELPDVRINIPPGWYEHRLSDTHIILTRQEDFPDIGATEGYAYGEQININVLPAGTPSKEWVSQNFIDLDDVLVKEAAWSIVDNGDNIIDPGDITFLRVEHETPADPQLTYYVFEDEYVYVFSLYPLEPQNTERLDTLESVIRSYTSVGAEERIRIDGTIIALAGDWSAYRNETLGIAFEYPSVINGEDIFVSEFSASERDGVTTEGGVTFYPDSRFGFISISVQHAPFTTLEEWFAWREEQVGYSIYKDGEIMIDGHRALVTHTPQEAGAPLHPEENRWRTTVFFKNDKLYKIFTRAVPYEDVQKIWETFQVL
ncbi:MAG: hypothetical protein COU90_02480 [Candidatus Ryanbacteria bacterium CG10_big_fil_rev_8_21_14_0_10_43_42]|uniref:Uncharacterized protein n=1 Tax=Candidatus Ryanbacteria bacterium CG10_big_fil_rev_8_21_14_0_10_43_42 TaxID=1974864 RepID=A0A2M8KWN9_9BACT|nr:MAG: hypothetical protein COU90_02480 [Candidatus Ryanbacteria bacterium CG10_big_fil_rev_8_21_14_0_10_43_42]